MDLSADVVSVLILLLPGFAGDLAYRSFSYVKSRSWHILLVSTTFFAFFSYCITTLFLKLVFMLPAFEERQDGPFSPLSLIEEGGLSSLGGDFFVFSGLASFFSIVLALVAAAVVNTNLFLTIARLPVFGSKSGFTNEWDSVFATFHDSHYLEVHLTDGSIYRGTVEFYEFGGVDRAFTLRELTKTCEGSKTLDTSEDRFFFPNLDNVKLLRWTKCKYR